MEGQFDLLTFAPDWLSEHDCAFGHGAFATASSYIKRYSENLMLCLDADRAGLAASAKNAESALRVGMRVKAVRLPTGKDPADLAHENPKDFTKRVGEAQSIVEFFLSVLTASEKDQHRLVMAAEKTVLPLIAAIQSPLEREHFVGVTARALGLTSEAVRASVPRSQNPAAAGGRANSDSRNKTSGTNVVSSVASASVRRGELILALAENYADKPLAESLKSEYSRIIGAVPVNQYQSAPFLRLDLPTGSRLQIQK